MSNQHQRPSTDAVLTLGEAEQKLLQELIKGVNENRTTIDAIAKQLGAQQGTPSPEVSAAFTTFEVTVGKLRNPDNDLDPKTDQPRVWTLS